MKSAEQRFKPQQNARETSPYRRRLFHRTAQVSAHLYHVAEAALRGLQREGATGGGGGAGNQSVIVSGESGAGKVRAVVMATNCGTLHTGCVRRCDHGQLHWRCAISCDSACVESQCLAPPESNRGVFTLTSNKSRICPQTETFRGRLVVRGKMSPTALFLSCGEFSISEQNFAVFSTNPSQNLT